MKTSTAITTSILAFIGLIQVCPAPPAVLGPIIIAADGAVGGSAIAAGINHSKDKRAEEKRADEMNIEQKMEWQKNEAVQSGCHNWPACE